MNKILGKEHNSRSARQKILESPVQVMPLPRASSDKLERMGFRTVKEAFRAALVGRLNNRKMGGVALENSVLETGCLILGHPILTDTDLKAFCPLENEKTVTDVIFRFNGRRTELPPKLLAASIRAILLPSGMHKSIAGMGIINLAELLETEIEKLLASEGIGPGNLGFFLAHIFDFIFILHEQVADHPEFEPGFVQEKPVETGLPGESLLASWLGEEMLAEGRALLDGDQLKTALFFRDTAGAIITDKGEEGLVYLSLTNNNEGSTTFQISTAVCDICAPQAHYQPRQCRHIAALALSMMTWGNKNDPFSSPLLFFFKKSPWRVIGNILFELFGQGGANDTTLHEKEGSWLLTIPGPTDRPWASWLLDQETAAVADTLFNDEFKWLNHPPEPANRQLLSALHRKLLDVGRTTAEAELNAFNKQTVNQERDRSLWVWLAARSCWEIPPDQLKLTGPEADGLFSLTATCPENGREVFRMTVPRARTPEIVDCLDRAGAEDLLLPVAIASTRIEMDDDGGLIISPLLKMTDGRVFDRHELKEQQYGRYYYLPGEGFLSVTEQAPENSCAKKPTGPTRFHPNKVPELLDKYQNSLDATENQVDPDLLELRLFDLPDNLEVSSFSTDDNWCYLSGSYGLGTRNISLVELVTARMQKNKFLAGGKDWLKLTDNPLEWFYNLGEERLWRDSQNNSEGVRLTKREMVMLSALVPNLQMGRETRGKDALQQLIDSDRWIEDGQIGSFPDHLRDYQRHGVAWLYQIYRNRLTGILADDMGLGKTHQALALITKILTDLPDSRFLVVCPATVVPHWEEKIRDFFPTLSHYVYHGSHRDLEKGRTSNIYITTYGIIRRDTKALTELGFELIILDEIQNIKNKKTDVYKAASHLKGEIIIGLTGTPFENSVYDLKAIFDVCLPGYLGSDRDFKKRYADPIETAGDRSARESLANLIDPFMLRRTREQVLTELPDVIEDFRTCELSEDQISLYRDLVSGRAQAIMNDISDEQENAPLPYMELLAVINYLKQVCNHPCLIKNCTDYNLYKSGKWDLFVELLDECLEAKMKIVVFSHYTRMLDIIEKFLTDRGISFCGLRGNMTMGKRYEMIKKFNNDPSCQVFSASLLAGGVGVDLTAAQAVIHYDRWWNAAREDQATARVHRMGQKNVVQVFKLITEGTLEEKISKIISKKRALANQLIKENDSAIIKRLSREELIDLLAEPSL